MTHLLAGILVVTAMVAPYVVVAALSATFPRLRYGIGQVPRTDRVVARFFDGTTPGADRVPFEDHPSWTTAESVGELR
jgi:hypothetical protein